MVTTPINPVSSDERIEILDVLRGLAIGGILIGNMQWYSGYGFMPQIPVTTIDQVTIFLVHFFVEGKFYSIFSFLFGIGFALQIARAEERGDLTASLFKRRLFWLLVIGLLHAYLLWAGDILSIYAVIGFLLILFRKKTDRSLIKWIVALLAIPILSYILLYSMFLIFAPPVGDPGQGKSDFLAEAMAIVSAGGYFEIITGFNLKYIVGRYMGLIFEMRLPKILAMFLLGFYVYRRGYFQDISKHKPLIRKVLMYGLILGIAGNTAFVLLAGSEALLPPAASGIPGVIAYGFGVPALALFYVALVTVLWQKAGWNSLLGILAPVGHMALTNYLLQTVVCLSIFYGYGFGLFGTVSATMATIMALVIFLFQILISAIWLKYFRYGPMEWVWRQLTYKKRLPILRVE